MQLSKDQVSSWAQLVFLALAAPKFTPSLGFCVKFQPDFSSLSAKKIIWQLALSNIPEYCRTCFQAGMVIN